MESLVGTPRHRWWPRRGRGTHGSLPTTSSGSLSEWTQQFRWSTPGVDVKIIIFFLRQWRSELIREYVRYWRDFHDRPKLIKSGWVETNLPNIHIFHTDVRLRSTIRRRKHPSLRMLGRLVTIHPIHSWLVFTKLLTICVQYYKSFMVVKTAASTIKLQAQG
jgi:hypothetical protein